MKLLSTANPTTLLLGIFLLSTPLLFTVDPVSAGVAIVIALCMLPLADMTWTTLRRRILPVLVVTPLSGISMLLYSIPGGKEYFSFWFITVSEHSVYNAVSIMLRVLALALVIIIVGYCISPQSLGEALAQVWHLPYRFVIASTSSLQLLGKLQDDYQQLTRARKIRGVKSKHALKEWIVVCYSLLIQALRQGDTLSTAMEVRGFGTYTTRTWAHPSKLRYIDYGLIFMFIVLGALPLVVAVTTGTFTTLGVR